MRGVLRVVVAVLALVAGVPPSGRAVAGAASVAIVVHPTRTEPLTVDDLSRIFLRRRRFWADGTLVVPLNLEVGHPARDEFTQRVLSMTAAQLTTYWNERYFHGVFPPAVVASSAAVKRFVSTDPRAVGYLPLSDVDDSVRVALTLRD